MQDSPVVDLIVPVYRGLEETRRCLDSVLTSTNRTRFELVLIDDASPEPALSAYLDQLAARGLARLLRNPRNLGFVASVNRGMALDAERDVVLLNSDTEVANDWLDRLRSCAYAAADTGSVTPFSNNATICSYPRFCADNPLPAGLDTAALDALFRRANAGESVEIPTGVGFCMYLRRDCLAAVGLFDEQRFGRGYGEENDFCRRAVRAGWTHRLCADTFVFHQGSVSFGDDRPALMQSGGAALLALHPDYDEVVRRHVLADPAAALRRRVDIELSLMRRGLPAAADGARPVAVQLHVLHQLGGGIARWARDFCAADGERRNLVLKPWSRSPDFGEGLALYRGPDDEQPERLWLFDETIHAVSASHAEYRAVLAQIIDECRVDAILVSSLIGHSLDVLASGLPTVVIQHDFFPACPAINAYFGEVCPSCPPERLADCAERNGDFNPFARFGSTERLAVRERFAELALAPQVTLVAPTHAVEVEAQRICPPLAAAAWLVIPHGLGGAPLLPVLPNAAGEGRRPRVVVLGMLAVSKGLNLLMAALDRLCELAELHLLGAGEVGELFRDRPGVVVHERYEPHELDRRLGELRPELSLLLSVCHESFSYTLSELMACGIPPLATRVGSFAERIREGETGYLFDPDPDSLVAALRARLDDRPGLARVAANLRRLPQRDARAMVEDYRRLLRATSEASPAWSREVAPATCAPLADARLVDMALAQSRQWQQNKRLHLLLELRERRTQQALAAARAAIQQIEIERQAAQSRIAALEAAVAQRETELRSAWARVDEMHASTSWRVSAPVRWLGRGLRARHYAARRALPPERQAGAEEAPPGPLDPIFGDYRSRLDAALPALAERVGRLPRRPLISLLVPSFETPEAMLREMLDAVLAQIYPEWELCVADDGSSQPHVRALLTDYAARDARIRPDFAAANHGVAHATNRALELARGEFAVLLDHDDLLEPQALLRVAEAIVADDPDMLYSDEALIDAEGRRVLHLALRPAFSPELLRAHPYIVHLAGYRTRFLRELGGVDERLKISQDYDLVLRASEHAQCIVHVPEILYRWRVHGGSAGHARMGEVMSASRGVLQAHLARCGMAGEVRDGASFNFFEPRYALAPGLRVAIVIPTRNHAALVRTCIESIERTVGVAHDIVLIDHDSDEPAAQAYFASLGERVRLLRYHGAFNFSAINNFAVARLGAEYSHLLFCNNDVEALAPGWLERMLELGQQPGVGIVGAKLYYPDRRTLQHAGVAMPCCGLAENLGRFLEAPLGAAEIAHGGVLVASHEVSAVTAACLLIRRSVFVEAGGFDEALAVGFGDVDLCLRVGALGYRVLLCAQAELLHHESFTRGRSEHDPHPEDSARFAATWQQRFASGDPYFSPGFAAHTPRWEIAARLPLFLAPLRRVWRREGERQLLAVSPGDQAA